MRGEYNLIDSSEGALAYWIMGDGSKSGTGLTLQTQSFTVKECVFIISILIYKFNIIWSIHTQRNQPTIYIHSKSIKQIKPNILHYFPFSRRYKL